jgi:RimJ/RimL family protein N-acetyltransferase
MPWIKHPVVLNGKLIRLEPLAELHFPHLIAIGTDPSIWAHLPFDGSRDHVLRQELGTALLNRAYGRQYPFTIIRQSDNRVIGSTRFFDLFPEHKKLEIGWTWYAPEVWGMGYNIECKLLLFAFCFEVLDVNRVQLKTRTGNVRSRKAIEKVGGVFEGVLRRDRVMPDGSVKDTIVYSVIKEEWPELKKKLTEMRDAL